MGMIDGPVIEGHMVCISFQMQSLEIERPVGGHQLYCNLIPRNAGARLKKRRF